MKSSPEKWFAVDWRRQEGRVLQVLNAKILKRFYEALIFLISKDLMDHVTT